MSKFSRFMKANKAVKENKKYAPTASLCDEDGKPLEWEFRHISSKETETIRESNTIDVPVTGKPGVFWQKTLSAKYIAALVAASVVYPDLYDKELQESYDADTPADLVMAMVDSPGEYSDLVDFVQTMNGFKRDMKEKVDEAKN